MPAPKGPLWEFFLEGEKQNSSHTRAHCFGCLDKSRPSTVPIELDSKGNPKVPLLSDAWVTEACKAGVGQALGVKEAMIAHILGKGGSGKCPHACKKAYKVAKQLKTAASTKKNGKRAQDTSSDDDSDAEDDQDGASNPAKKRKLLANVEKAMSQSKLKVFRGIHVSFTDKETPVMHRQFLRATISANLPYRWIENVEVIKLFIMFRSTAVDILPARGQLSGKLLDEENARVQKELRTKLKGKYAVMMSDRWKDISRDSINGVSLTVEGKSHLIELILATAEKKDGSAMCEAFVGMIDRAEEVYRVVIIAFCCDNDGGSQRGRKDLILKRPWLFGPPCCAHQFQLILGEYFKVNKEAAATAEEATDLIGWVLNHQRVRAIFNETQAEGARGKVLAVLMANLTRWTTHLVAFRRLLTLKDPFCCTVISKRAEIIAAQVGAEKNCQKQTKLRDDATEHCDLINDNDFWRQLSAVCDDLEPICLGLNMNQTNTMRADKAVLTFAGIYLYFSKHPRSEIATAMVKHVEKRWHALDQPMFILALVLNPYEGMSRFGDQASVSPFKLNTLLIETYRRVHSRPPSTPRTPDEEDHHQVLQDTAISAVSDAFLSYLGGAGAFTDWKENKEAFQQVHGDDPMKVWETFLLIPATFDLAEFAILILSITVNQGGLERNFSDLKVKKSAARNRIKLSRLEKMAKVGANIRELHANEGLIEERGKRKNHDSAKVHELLAVPRYADAFEHLTGSEPVEGAEGEPVEHIVVQSRKGWRAEMSKWVAEVQEQVARDSELDPDHEAQDIEALTTAMYSPTERRSKWLPRSLALLFGGQKETDIEKQMAKMRREKAYTEEGRLMELLVDEEEGETILDDGELEGSGDDFDG